MQNDMHQVQEIKHNHKVSVRFLCDVLQEKGLKEYLREVGL